MAIKTFPNGEVAIKPANGQLVIKLPNGQVTPTTDERGATRPQPSPQDEAPTKAHPPSP
ncbi:hypothetical protein ACOZ38_05170 [Sphaerisporangium viridialbum]|uniref:hypothetical protein n=1 Tax=Sphaerisporangium viridialbum TaxID=46189 RepID=UPI003C73F052